MHQADACLLVHAATVPAATMAAVKYAVATVLPAGACLLLAAIASVACLVPARRASRLDALVALRHE